MYVPGKFDWLIPTGISLINLGLEKNISPDWNIRLFVELPIAFVACAGTWYFMRAGLIQQGHVQPDGEGHTEAELAELARAEWARQNDLEPVPVKVDGKPLEHVYELTVTRPHIPQPDKRWQMWATAMLNGQPTTQARWTGRGQLFPRTVYAPQIDKWLAEEKLRLKNPKNKKDGVKPNRGTGWKYFCDLATGREMIPLPCSE